MRFKSVGTRLRAWSRDLRDCTRGSALPILAAGFLPALAAIGSAVDLTRLYLVKTQMQSGVDAAALAGARSFGDATERTEQVDTYFDENFPTGFMGAPTSMRPARSFSTVNGINVTEVSARTDLPMVFMQVFGINSRVVTAQARAELQPRPLEVMVVLDDTGSMQGTDVGGGSRMDALKRAMNTFIETLHQGAASREELALGFVTYNVTTNVGDILTRHHVGMNELDGFTNIGTYTEDGKNGAANPLGWLGCVMNDPSIQNVSNSPAVSENGAWDVSRSLPGEVVNNRTHPKIDPYLYPPISRPSSNAKSYNFDTAARLPGSFKPAQLQANTSDSRRNNHYLLSPGGRTDIGQKLANSPAYKQWFYDFYIGLNRERSSDTDDVITKPANGGYYDPAVGGPFEVQYTKIPYITDTTVWGQPNAKYGYPLGTMGANGYTLKMPQPNWQCPEPSMELAYGRQKSTYLNYIRDKNYPVMPASGTLHHIGLLWGYRLLTRSDVFTRVNPINDQKPLRALVFMTDGETSVSEEAEWFGAYGRIVDKRIANSDSRSNFQTQVMRRFAKVCANAKKDDITVYIVSLKADVDEFRTCAGSRYLLTYNANQIDSAFEQIAVDLVDLHLTL